MPARDSESMQVHAGSGAESMDGGPSVDEPIVIDISATRIIRAPGMQDDNLRIRAVGFASEEVRPFVMVLIDTGAQVSLIRRGIIPSEMFRKSPKPVRLVAAGKQVMHGGDREVELHLQFEGVFEGTDEKTKLFSPSTFYEADIADDLIVSYTWLGQRGFEVIPRRHGIVCEKGGLRIWVPGVPASEPGPSATPSAIRRLTLRPKRALDLFSGTGSAAKVLRAHGYDVVTVDNDPKWLPDVLEDILTWDYAAAYAPGHFDIIVAAPPCTEFSRALTTRPRRPDQAIPLVRKVLEIVDHLQPALWWLETPAHGLLARSELMKPYPYVDCDQCQFGD